jgi:SAM-dependent methyltransferase
MMPPDMRQNFLRRQFNRIAGRARMLGQGTAPTPSGSEHAYQERIAFEKSVFTNKVTVHDLPLIFHYWSNRYLRPLIESFGFSNPDAFFVRYLERAKVDAADRTARFISLGAGNCDLEVRLALALKQRGVGDFTIECLDLNPAMLERGRSLAHEKGVAAEISTTLGDFNTWRPSQRYDAIIANQSLHHVLELEHLLDAIHAALSPCGVFVTSDMIGRNGHLRWPEALDIVREFWAELPPEYRYNLKLNRHEETFIDWDCSGQSFEGIRAQDILPLLIERFHFELFIGFGNVIYPFIDRCFGHHYDPQSEWDRDFIDRVHARDEAEILAGRIKPTQMFAVMRRDAIVEPAFSRHLTPAFCVRKPD